jgi:hypothetical protein
MIYCNNGNLTKGKSKMNSLSQPLNFTVPLGEEAHQLAQQFRQHQRSPQKAKQVYLNTLAVYAVKFYLQCMEIETNWEASDSYNPVRQTLMNVADLEIPNVGTLECRPVLPSSPTVEIPSEVWEDRMGYVAVQLDQSLRKATILGFVDQVAAEEVPLSQLHSLEGLLKKLSQSQSVQPVNSLVKERVNLGQWLHNIIDTGWETVEALFAPPQAQLATNFRNPLRIKATTSETSPQGVKRGKLIDWEQESSPVALFVGLTPTDSPELDISVEVCPTGSQDFLPHELTLLVLDEKGEAVMQAQSRGTKRIQLEFSGVPGEQFGIKVALGDMSVTEAFVI